VTVREQGGRSPCTGSVARQSFAGLCRPWRVVVAMVQFGTLAECFNHFGAVCAHRSYSRSAISSDGRIVVVAVWEDEIARVGDRLIYETRYRPDLKGKARGAHSEWIANLKWACAHCNSQVRVVIMTAKDFAAEPPEILQCYPDDSLIMRVIRFDVHTGVFRAESV
jgi:hypothetical protein